MTLSELKLRCEALANCGDDQAKTTLMYLFGDPQTTVGKLVELQKANDWLMEKNTTLAEGNKKRNEEIATLKKKIEDLERTQSPSTLEENAVYFLKKIATTMEAAKALGCLPPPKSVTPMQQKPKDDEFVGVKIQGEIVDGIIPRPPAGVPHRQELADVPTRELGRDREASESESARIVAIGNAFGISGSEAKALAATRKAQGLPDTSAPEVTAAASGGLRVGYEKVPGSNKDGNKE